MIVQPKAPCRIRYKLRDPATIKNNDPAKKPEPEAACPAHQAEKTSDNADKPSQLISIKIDKQLCQGHSMCIGEADDIFELGDDGLVSLKIENPDIKTLERVKNAAKHCPNQVLTVCINGTPIDHHS